MFIRLKILKQIAFGRIRFHCRKKFCGNIIFLVLTIQIKYKQANKNQNSSKKGLIASMVFQFKFFKILHTNYSQMNDLKQK